MEIKEMPVSKRDFYFIVRRRWNIVVCLEEFLNTERE